MLTTLGPAFLALLVAQAAPPPSQTPPPAPPASKPGGLPAGGAPVREGTGQDVPTGPVAPSRSRTPSARPTPPAGGPAAMPTTRPVATPAPAAPAAAPAQTAPPVGEDGMIDGPPPIQAEPPVLDFGFITPKSESKGSFKLWNRGTTPLTILAVQPSCKCTTTNDLADSVIKPGEFAELQAALDGAPLPGPRKANIKVLVDGYSRVLELELKGEVAYPLRAPPGYLNVVKGQEQKGRLLVEAIDKKPFRICNIQGEKPEYIGFDPERDEPRSSYLVRWDISKFGDKIPPYWIIVSDRDDCPILPVRVRHESTIPKPIFRLKEYSVNLGRMEPGKPTEVEILMEDPGEPIIAAAVEHESFRAELVGSEMVEGTLHVKVRVTPRPEFEGLATFPLTLYSGTKEMNIAAFGLSRASGKSNCGS